MGWLPGGIKKGAWRRLACVILLAAGLFWLRYQFLTIFSMTKSSTAPSVNITNIQTPEEEDLKALTKLLKQRLLEKNDAPRKVFNATCGTPLKGCIDPTCKHPLGSDPAERLKKIVTSPNLTLSASQSDLIRSIVREIPENDVIFVSASTSNHYNEMQAMFHNLHTVVYPQIKNFTVVFFDIGLTAEQREKTEKNCRCQVVTFPFHLFPTHVSTIRCYSWKPLIVFAAMSVARKMVVWLDNSIRWINDPQFVLDRADKYGVQYLRSGYIDSVSANTLKQTFDYLAEEPCAYLPYPEIQVGITLHKKDPLVVRALLEPWARCALEAKCMCPVNPRYIVNCKKPSQLHRCHRFEQSVLTILAAKLYTEDMYRIIAPESKYKPWHFTVWREHIMPSYFVNITN